MTELETFKKMLSEAWVSFYEDPATGAIELDNLLFRFGDDGKLMFVRNLVSREMV